MGITEKESRSWTGCPRGQSSQVCVCICDSVWLSVCICIFVCMSGFVCAERWEEITASIWKREKGVGLFKGGYIITTVVCLRGQSPPKYSSCPSALVDGKCFKLPGNPEPTNWGWGEWIPPPAGYLLGPVTTQRPWLCEQVLPVPVNLCYHFVGLGADLGEYIPHLPGPEGNP